MTIIDALILGSACAYLAVFATKCRDAWNESYYNDDGTRRS